MTYDRGYHFGFSDATGDNTVELFGRLQLDAGGYTGYNPAPMTLDRKGLSDGVDLRRARIGVIGTFMTDWHYAFRQQQHQQRARQRQLEYQPDDEQHVPLRCRERVPDL
jgi:hypothetical protein